MAGGAKVESIDALTSFRLALVKFREAAVAALGDADGDIQRVLNWVENDQDSFWTSQVRLRQDALMQARDSLRQKTIFRDSTGRTPSAVEEQKAVTKAQQRLDEAQRKLAAVRHWGKFLQREILVYKGQVQRFVTSVAIDIPAAIAHLGGLINTLTEYTALNPDQGSNLETADAGLFSVSGAASMSRGQAPVVEQRPYAHLRSRSPKPDARSVAPLMPQASAAWAAGALNETTIPAVAALHVNWIPINPAEILILAIEVEQNQRIFLDHSQHAAGPGDSGWFIGPVDDQPIREGRIPYESLSIADLLAVRPDWRQFFSLPAGYLVVLDRGGIVAILNDRDENIWSPNSGAAGEAVP